MHSARSLRTSVAGDRASLLALSNGEPETLYGIVESEADRGSGCSRRRDRQCSNRRNLALNFGDLSNGPFLCFILVRVRRRILVDFVADSLVQGPDFGGPNIGGYRSRFRSTSASILYSSQGTERCSYIL